MMRSIVLAALAGTVATHALAQAGSSVELRGLAGQRVILTSTTLATLPRREVSANAHGVAGRFAGVSLADVVRLVGAPAGDSLRGPALAAYLLVEASDGYRVTFALAEFSPSFTDRVILLADTKDGKPLDAHDGPMQLVVPDEKRPARWVRQVSRISVVPAPPTRP